MTSKGFVLYAYNPESVSLFCTALKEFNYHHAATTNDLEEVLSLVNQKTAELVVVEDSIERPAALMMREMLRYPSLLSTPTLVYLLQNPPLEELAISKTLDCEVIKHPLTGLFSKRSISRLKHRWNSPHYKALTAGMNYWAKYPNKGIEIFQKLAPLHNIKHLTSAALSRILLSQDEAKEAERIVLQWLKKSPTCLTSILTLSDLYVLQSAPHLSNRLLQIAEKAYPKSSIVALELIQINTLLGQFDIALSQCEILKENDILSDKLTLLKAKLHLALGNIKEVENLLISRLDILDNLFSAWHIN